MPFSASLPRSQVQESARHAEPERRYHGPRAVEDDHGLLEVGVDPVEIGDAAILQHEILGVPGADAHLLDLAEQLEPGRALLNDEAHERPHAVDRRPAHQDQGTGRAAEARAIDLLAVENPLAGRRIAGGGRAYRRRIGACARLRYGDRQLLVAEPGHLLRCAGIVDDHAAEPGARAAHSDVPIRFLEMNQHLDDRLAASRALEVPDQVVGRRLALDLGEDPRLELVFMFVVVACISVPDLALLPRQGEDPLVRFRQAEIDHRSAPC